MLKPWTRYNNPPEAGRLNARDPKAYLVDLGPYSGEGSKAEGMKYSIGSHDTWHSGFRASGVGCLIT